MLTAVVVDDELPAREELKCLIEEVGGWEVIGECDDGDGAAELVERLCPQVVFLDIRMRLKDGIVAAVEILELENPPRIVFTTGFSEYAVKAFELGAVNYILKPYARERVENALNKIAKELKTLNLTEDKVEFQGAGPSQPENLCIWHNDRIVIVQPGEVVFAKADERRQTMLYTDRGIFHTKMTLREVEQHLRQYRFLRTHKSYLVNINRVREVIPWFNNTYVLVLADCEEKNIPVARHYVKEFNQAMGIS